MVTGLWNHVESGRLAEFSVLPDPAFSRVSGRYSRACWSPERVLSGVFLDGARFFLSRALPFLGWLVRLGFLRAGVACRASLAAHDLVCLGCRGCVLRDGCFWPVRACLFWLSGFLAGFHVAVSVHERVGGDLGLSSNGCG